MDDNNKTKAVIGVLCLVIALIWLIDRTAVTSKNQNQYIPSHKTETEAEPATDKAEEEKLILPIGVEGIENPETDYLTGEIKIPRTIKADKNGIVEITEPIGMLPKNIENPKEKAIYTAEILLKYGVDVEARGNADGTVTLTFSEKNWEKYIQVSEQFIDFIFKEVRSKVSLSNDYKKVIIYIDDDTDPMYYSFDSYEMWVIMVYAQILSGTPCHEWSANIVVVYESTGEIMLEFTLDEQHGYSFTDEDWNAMFEKVEH